MEEIHRQTAKTLDGGSGVGGWSLMARSLFSEGFFYKNNDTQEEKPSDLLRTTNGISKEETAEGEWQ